MNKVIKGNAYSPVTWIEYTGTQPAPHETNQVPQSPNCEPTGRTCYGCGTVLKDPGQYIIDWIGRSPHPLCMGCYKKKN